MNFKRLFCAGLLAGSLLLASCDFMTPLNQQNRNKSNEESDIQESIEPYEGIKGATQLSEQEWEKAFSLKDTLLNRNIKLKLYQSNEMIINCIDHGKVKMMLYDDDMLEETLFYNVKSINKKNIASYDYCYKDYNYGWSLIEKTGYIEPLAATFGILDYKYYNFTYDAATDSYYASSFAYIFNLDEGGIFELDITNCHITIKDGLPSRISFDFVENGYNSSNPQTMTCYYTYDCVTVNFPEIGSQEEINDEEILLPLPSGDEITYQQFAASFRSRLNPPEAYNHVTISIYAPEPYNYNEYIEAVYIYDMWETNSDTYKDSRIRSLIITEDDVASLDNEYSLSSSKQSFYYNASNQTFIYRYEYGSAKNKMIGNVIFDKYFYTITQEIYFNEIFEYFYINWSHVEIPSYRVMDVTNRSFIGTGIKESGFESYDESLLFVQNSTLSFDTSGNFRLVSQYPKRAEDGSIEDVYVALYGQYEKTTNGVTLSITVIIDGSNAYTYPENNPEKKYIQITNDKLVMTVSISDSSDNVYDVHFVYQFVEPLNDTIVIPIENN